MLITIITFLVLLLILVLAHEAGHFFAAKKLGIAVEEFGFGFPPRAASVKRGGTIYSLNWLPLGGFVRLKGEDGDSSAADSFVAQSALCRLLVIVAGVAMNFLLAAVLLSVSYGLGVRQEINGPLAAGARLRDHSVQVVVVLAASPAARAGVVAGDELLAVAGTAVSSAADFRERIAARLGQPTAITFRRQTGAVSLTLIPETLKESGRPGIGIGLLETGVVSYPWYRAPLAGVRATLIYTREIFKALGQLVLNLVRTGRPNVEVTGPVGIAALTGQVARLGLVSLLEFAALLSLNLGIINILPIPALDGGRVLFLVLGKTRGRTISPRVESLAHQVGFAALLLIVVLVTFHDILRFFR